MSNKKKQVSEVRFPKLIHLPRAVIKKVTIKAAQAETNFKNYVEALIAKDAGK